MNINNNNTNTNWSSWNNGQQTAPPLPVQPGQSMFQPMFIPMPFDDQLVPGASLSDVEKGTPIKSVVGIYSNRKPYAQVELITKYGNLDSRVGTGLGLTRY
jgi:hypothetical protein